jgi:hypothetical protein
MSDPEMLDNEISENGSTGYSEFCDDDAILAADETVTLDDVPQDRFTAAAEGSSPSAPACSTLTSGKRKSPDDFVLSDRDGPSASYRRRTIPSSIDLESSASSSTDSGVTLPFLIVRIKFSEHLTHLINYRLDSDRHTMGLSSKPWTRVRFHGAYNGRSRG